MAITKVKVSNFKSFDELEVELRPLNVVVGGNASGKSNFLEIFRFLRDLVTYGLENAISLQGGMEYLTNLQIGAARPLVLELTYDDLKPFPAIYRLVLSSVSSGTGFQILEDDLAQKLPFDLAIYDLDPKLGKRAIPIGGKADLEPDGSNLAIVLRNVLQDSSKRAMLVRLLSDLLPFVEDLKVDRVADQSILVALKERFSPKSYLPASLLSDGTIHLTALILALYFERAAVTLIEEPERHLHPHLISRIAGMLRDASQRKQLVVTTHNPELVKHADLADLLLVHRDEQGFSRLSRPAESQELKVFLENDLGVDELYVQDLLHTGHGV